MSDLPCSGCGHTAEECSRVRAEARAIAAEARLAAAESERDALREALDDAHEALGAFARIAREAEKRARAALAGQGGSDDAG